MLFCFISYKVHLKCFFFFKILRFHSTLYALYILFLGILKITDKGILYDGATLLQF